MRTKRVFTPFGEVFTGRKGSLSVSATCCGNRDLALKRLGFKLSRFNFVVEENENDLEKELEFRGRKVVFCNPEGFVQFFEDRFGLKIDKSKILEYDLLEEFIKRFDDRREALAVLNSMYLLYIYREFPEVFIHTKDSRSRMEIEPDIPMLEEVKNLGYGFSYPKTSHPRVRMNYLNDNGREIARSVLEHKLRNSKAEIESIVNKFGARKVFFITLGTMRKDGLFLKDRKPEYTLALSSTAPPDILSKLHIADKSLFKELKDVQSILQLISRFITTFAIYDDALRFFNELERLGFALKVRIFSLWGVELGTAFRAPIELAEHLMENWFFEPDTVTQRKFVEVLTRLYLKAIRGVAGERMLNELLMGLDFDPVNVDTILEENQNSSLEMAELVASILSESLKQRKN